MQIADINNDGLIDIAATNFSELVIRFPDNVSVFLGNGGGAFAKPVSFGAGSRPTEMAFADFNSDGATDFVLVNSEGRDVSVLLNRRPPNAGGEGEATENALIAFGLPEGEDDDASALDATIIDDFLRSLPNWNLS